VDCSFFGSSASVHDSGCSFVCYENSSNVIWIVAG
jgi:hypothetical protein